jgi:uncharacterized membrane protein
MFDDPLFILAILSLNVVVAEVLVRRTVLRHFGTALLVILVTALVANLGVIPTGSRGVPLYDGVFSYLAPLAIFWLLLQVNLRQVLRAGLPMIVLFLMGSLGTMLGALLGMAAVDGSQTIGPMHHAVAGMFTGTYTGGSANFNAIALQYEVGTDGPIYLGCMAVDNIFTTIWMVTTIVIPRAIARFRPGARSAEATASTGEVITGEEDDTETVHPIDIGLLVFLGTLAVWGSKAFTDWLAERTGVELPWVILLTTSALVLAQLPAVRRLRGTRLLGMFAVYIFLAVIGAYCDVAEFLRIGSLGVTLFVFAAIVVTTHGVVIFGSAALFRLPIEVAAVASQANIGGGTSALALARSLGRRDLVLPAILVGSLGTGLGTYLGWAVAERLATGM